MRGGGGGRLGLGWGLRHVLMNVDPESRYLEQELLFNKCHNYYPMVKRRKKILSVLARVFFRVIL